MKAREFEWLDLYKQWAQEIDPASLNVFTQSLANQPEVQPSEAVHNNNVEVTSNSLNCTGDGTIKGLVDTPLLIHPTPSPDIMARAINPPKQLLHTFQLQLLEIEVKNIQKKEIARIIQYIETSLQPWAESVAQTIQTLTKDT
ncbi:hypothetical protein CIHG_10256 [Coccidioides immitis H538.4]|uniref:Uncharacterized protein n=1 Tax=Coccidioides immitis H538.4 TaxID=396776 RepID=A0A0J8S6D6_COCIT|nr:hypothetical protein CIHG_10256 [Coccidioides immitis H538.4]